jgi:amidase
MTYLSAIEQLKQLDSGQVSARELVDAAIGRIESKDKDINAVVARDFDRARKDAEKADADRRKGNIKPLLGLPVSVKEGFDVAGLVTSWGLPGDFKPAAEDAVLVKRLREAGAIILGKTNVATMLADWQTANPRYGATSNPRDVAKTPGGSSGGGAAAIAAGMPALEFGSDLAGSLRIPASFCGVFAHRPSYGLVPMRGFAPPMAPRAAIAAPIDQSVVGPIARSAADLSLALGIVAGPDSPDVSAFTLRLPVETRRKLSEFRVLVLDEHPLCPTAAEVRRAIAGVAKVLDANSVKIARTSTKLPSLTDLARTFRALLMAQMGADTPLDQYNAARTASDDDFDSQSLAMSHRDWIELDRHRIGLQVQWENLFTEFDLVLCPASPVAAFPHDTRPMEQRRLRIDGRDERYDILPIWSTLTNPTGLPSTVVPFFHEDGILPVGIQVIGRRYADMMTLWFAELLESEIGGFRHPATTE